MRNLKIAVWTLKQLAKLSAAVIPFIVAAVGIAVLRDKR